MVKGIEDDVFLQWPKRKYKIGKVAWPIPGSPGTKSLPVTWERIQPVARSKVAEYHPTLTSPGLPPKPQVSPYPHLALVNLDFDIAHEKEQAGQRLRLSDITEDAVLGFVNAFGLLGLGQTGLTRWVRWQPHPYVSDPPMVNDHNAWFYVMPDKQGTSADNYCEPLDAFREAVREFQAAAECLVDMPAEERRYRIAEFGLEAWGYLRLQVRPFYEDGRFAEGKQVTSLLSACYLLWFRELELRPWGYRRCRTCGRIFLPGRENGAYCSDACGDAGGMRARTDRILRREIAALSSNGRMTGDQARQARRLIDEEWRKGGSCRYESHIRQKLIEAGFSVSGEESAKKG